MRIEHRFVDSFPKVSDMTPGVLYVSLKYRSAAHLCACGCGAEVVTPIRKGAWRFEFDGDSVTLHPSIGSGNLQCQSHYFIRDGVVQWVPDWTAESGVGDETRPTSIGSAGGRHSLWSFIRGLFKRS